MREDPLEPGGFMRVWKLLGDALIGDHRVGDLLRRRRTNATTI